MAMATDYQEQRRLSWEESRQLWERRGMLQYHCEGRMRTLYLMRDFEQKIPVQTILDGIPRPPPPARARPDVIVRRVRFHQLQFRRGRDEGFPRWPGLLEDFAIRDNRQIQVMDVEDDEDEQEFQQQMAEHFGNPERFEMNQRVEEQGKVIGEMPIQSIPYDAFHLNQIKEACRHKSESDTVKFHSLRNYLMVKQKGAEMGSVFSIVPAFKVVGGTIQFFLEVDEDFAQELSYSLGNPSISAQLTVGVVKNARGASGAGGRGRPCSTKEYDFKTKPGGAKISELPNSKPRKNMIKLKSPNDHIIKRQDLEGIDSEILTFSWTMFIEFEDFPLIKQPSSLKKMAAQKIYNSGAGVLQNEIKIVAANGAEIGCHKSILKAQSPVLNAMLEHDTSEAQTGRIELFENSAEGLEMFIRCLYGFQIPASQISSDLALEVFELSDKYGVKEVEQSMKELLCDKGMGLEWYSPDSILELYFYVRNIDRFKELKIHSLVELTTLLDHELETCDYFQKLSQQEATELLVKIQEWL